MPDNQFTTLTYAAGASLAAITLIYVFAPTFLMDEQNESYNSRKKRVVVGLVNNANDCFINSVLQALAGLGDLRIYLIRETHRRGLDSPEVYTQIVEDPARQGLPAWKIEGLQKGLVTTGLKEMLDALNERPLYKKTISAGPFVTVLESAFKQRISRQQQDAQEFLQVVAERLCDEYHAGHRARDYARKLEAGTSAELSTLDESVVVERVAQLDLNDNAISSTNSPGTKATAASSHSSENASSTSSGSSQRGGEPNGDLDKEDEFPFEGGSESQIECLTCGFKPRPTQTTFCSLTLTVPQVTSTTLNACFDGMFKTEFIEDFKCEKCRLIHALKSLEEECSRSTSEKFKRKAQTSIDKLKAAIETNPEEELLDAELPDLKFAPKRKIAKHVRITKFPKVMAIHLSRSIFDSRSTMKNSAKVTFPEQLSLGGLLDRRKYKLLSLVCHKGNHHSGHYESFRRQNVVAPFSTPHTFQPSAAYARSLTSTPSLLSTPQVNATRRDDGDNNTLSSTPELLSPTTASTSSLSNTNGRSSSDSAVNNKRLSGINPISASSIASSSKTARPTSAPRDSDSGSIRSLGRSARKTLSKVSSTMSRSSTAPSSPKLSPSNQESTRISFTTTAGTKRKKKTVERWWRISDEKIKESKTSEVLGMQKEVYMLFYELERGEEDS